MPLDPHDRLVGQLVSGRYRVVKPLGEGGMGQVYLALHEAIEKQIALKVLRPEYSAKEDIVTRFQQEAISASRIKHPNVLEVFDFGRLDNGCAYLAMEYLSGNDLADELARYGHLGTRRALRITLQVCRALSSAHKAHVVHRDMKPDNVFLQRTVDGEEIIKIVDFGIAQLRNPDEEAKSTPPRRRLTKTGMIFGTPEYMAPEQAAGKQADQRVDVYAVGIILFEMLTGAVPFTGDSFMAVLAAHLNDPVPSMLRFRPDLNVSRELHDVVARALSKDPDQRFASMTDFAAALLTTPEGQALQASGELQPTTLPPPPPNPGQAHPTRPQGSGRESDPVHAGRAAEPAAGSAAPAPERDRPQTLAAATTTEERPPPKRSGNLGVMLGLLGVLGALGVGSVVVLSQSRTEPVAAAVPSNTPATASDPSPTAERAGVEPAAAESLPSPPSAATPNVQPVAAEPGEPEPSPPGDVHKVKISVQTDPPGALLEKDGFQVCDKTPCDVELEPGEGVQFDAVLGNRRGSAKVLAQNDQSVTIALRAPVAKKPAQKKLCEVNVGGLKILRECPE